MSFPSTHWSLLAIASLNGNADAQAAVARLCERYRLPVIVYLKQHGYSDDVVEDVAQEFFLELIQSRAWKRADRVKGRFRTFLLGTLTHVAGHMRDRDNALRRGGGEITASFDEMAENGFEPPSATTEDCREFDRAWVLGLMKTTLAGIARPYLEAGRDIEWQVISQFLPGAGTPPTYEEAAAQAGLTLAAFRAAVHHVRALFRANLRAAVALTVSAAHEIDDELAYLHRVLTSPGA